MTKKEIRSLVTNYLGRIDKTNKYHPEVVDATIERAFNQAFSDIFFRSPIELDNYTKEYTNSGGGYSVTNDVDTRIDYVDLPADYVPLPDVASGVRGVYSITTGGTVYYPMTAKEFELASNTANVQYVAGGIGYVVRGSKIELWNYGTSTDRLRFQILIPFRTYSDTDDVLMPFSRDVDLMKAVLELLGVVPPTDLADNNADINVENRQ